jgi:DNA-binding CsgD family transcriptional regulator
VKQTTVRARVRQLCCLGLPSEMLMASLLPALRELVPSDSAGFFWVDSRGDMKNLYAERMLPADVMALYFEQFYDGRESAFRRGFLERAKSPDGVIATTAEGDFTRSAYYNEILRKLEAHHVLYGIVREQGAALGQISLYRSPDAPAFSSRERADLSSVIRYVAHGIAAGGESMVNGTTTFQDSEDEALLITDANGTVRHASEKARRLLLLATTSDLNPASMGAAVNERASQALRNVCARLEAVERGEDTAPPVMTLDSKWGRYVMRAYWLDDDHSALAPVGVRIQRQEPMILRFVQAMGRLPLSPQQREIALMIAQGRSNQEIAEGLGVSGNTVAYHIKQLFLKLDVHDRAGAVEHITSGRSGLKG